MPAIGHSVGLGIPNAICPSIKANGNFATAQLMTRLGRNGVSVMPSPGSGLEAQCEQCHGCKMEELVRRGDECRE